MIQQPAIIPRPAHCELLSGTFELRTETAILTDSANEWNGSYLRELLAADADGSRPDAASETSIRLSIGGDAALLDQEGYELAVSETAVSITAQTTTGVFYGIQTLRQLLPAGQTTGSIPCLRIEDKPRFSWRGFMLDEGRHFQGKETVLRLLDAMALLKLNIFHWHLSEDQGWRLEIKRYPRLTEIGSRRDGTAQGFLDMARKRHNGVPHGGYYTQDEVRKVVAYAKKRYINVVPEIEMPGHSLAALAAYPEFSCTGGPFTVPTHFGIFKDVYCAGKEATFTFLQDVLDEVMMLFPGRYIHIGGDEAPRARWKKCPDCQQRIVQEGLANEHDLQLYLTNRMAKYLAENGRTLVGWNEILNDDLDPPAIAQYWLRNKKGMVAAINNGRRAILSPNWHYYLDYSYSLTSLSKTYNHEPLFTELSDDAVSNVLGVEAPLWTEFVPDPERLGYQVFPRLTAVAESAWSRQEQKDLDNFRQRLPHFLPRLEQIGLVHASLAEVEPSKIKQRLGIFTFMRP